MEGSINILKKLFSNREERSSLTKQFEDSTLEIKLSLLMSMNKNESTGIAVLSENLDIIESDTIFQRLIGKTLTDCQQHNISDFLISNTPTSIKSVIDVHMDTPLKTAHISSIKTDNHTSPKMVLSAIVIEKFTAFNNIILVTLTSAETFNPTETESILKETVEQFHHYNYFLDKLDLEFNKQSLHLKSLMTFINNLSEASECLIYIKDINGKYVAANGLYTQFIGSDFNSIIGKTTDSIKFQDSQNSFYLYDNSVIQLQPNFASGFSEVKDIQGNKHYLHFFKLAFSSNHVNKQLLFSIAFTNKSTWVNNRIEDTSENNYTLHISHTDQLTKLPNRILFNERLQQALIQARRTSTTVGIIIIDLDGFKRINDTLGHSQGDILLKTMANRLKKCVRETDTIARMGGDEFAIILTNLNYNEISTVIANKILKSVAEPVTINGHDLVITTSIGITFYPDDGNNIDSLISNADSAMYLAKSEGKNNFQYYSSSMNEISFERLMLESNIRKSIRNNDFVIYLQPRVNTLTEEIESAEVLIRWKHPELGIISPGKFIPVAEDTGLIIEIGNWLFEHVAQTIRDWIDRGISPCKLSINLSPKQFKQKDLLSVILNSLADHRIDKKLIELEITESTAMKDAAEAIATLNKIHDEGINISIDDFGTGYSSLSYLKKFPIQCLKIDRSFIKDIPEDSDDMAITRAIISLSKSLNMSVVAEGVETKEQVDFLKNEDCDEIQGFYFYKPMPVSSFETLLINKTEKK